MQQKRYRDAETGRIITKQYAESHKKTTVAETIKKQHQPQKGKK